MTRSEALAAILAIRLPPDWEQDMTEFHRWERVAFRFPPGAGPGQGVSSTGMLAMAAQIRAGFVKVSGSYGIEITTPAESLQAAVDHVIAWINHAKEQP